MSFLFGGGDEKTTQTQTQTPQYPAQSADLFSRELALLQNILFPLEQQGLTDQINQMMGYTQNNAARQGAMMAAPIASGLIGGTGQAAAMPLDAAIQQILGGLQAGAPDILAGRAKSLMPPQYANLFQPTMHTESSTDAPGPGVFETTVGLGSLIAPMAVALCWVADALYGEGSDEAEAARYWVTIGWQGRLANSFRWLYRRVGPQTAVLVKRHRLLRAVVKPLFNSFVRRGRWAQVQSFQRIYG